VIHVLRAYEQLAFKSGIKGIAVVDGAIFGVDGARCYAWDRISREDRNVECNPQVKYPFGIAYVEGKL